MEKPKLRFFKKHKDKEEINKVEPVEKVTNIDFVPRANTIKEKVVVEKKITDKEIVDNTCKILNNIKNSRIEGSKEERETANYLLDETSKIFGKTGALEPFYVSNFSHNYGLIIISVIFLIALITFPFSPLGGLLIGFVGFTILVNRVIFKMDVFKGFTKKDISFNVVNEIPSKENTKNTLIITSNYSTSRNWFFNRFIKINTKAFIICTGIFILTLFICLVVLAAGINNIGLYVFTGILMGLQVIVPMFFYSFDKKNRNVKYGLSGVGLSIMTAWYFKEHPKLVGDNTEIVLLINGGGVDGANGTKAFVKEHFKNNNDYKNAVVIGFESIVDDVALFSKDPKNRVTSAAYERLCKDPISKQRGIIKGYGPTVFDSVGIDAVSIGASQYIIQKDFNNNKDDGEMVLEDYMDELYKYLPIVTDLIKELNKE